MSTLKYRPIMDRVLIKRDKIEQTKSGIILTADGKARELNTGIVIDVGDGCTHPFIQPGKKVHWGKNAGVNIAPEHLLADKAEEFFICAEADILGVFDDPENPMQWPENDNVKGDE
jgi:co-chaperonin GroES (HSP10)